MTGERTMARITTLALAAAAAMAFGTASASALEPDSLWDVQILKAAAPPRMWDDPTLAWMFSFGLWPADRPDLYAMATAGLGRTATAGSNLFCVAGQKSPAGEVTEEPVPEAGEEIPSAEYEPRPRCVLSDTLDGAWSGNRGLILSGAKDLLRFFELSLWDDDPVHADLVGSCRITLSESTFGRVVRHRGCGPIAGSPGWRFVEFVLIPHRE
jgi:hypothetical protein